MISLGLSAFAFTAGPLKAAAPARASTASMAVGLIYSTSTGNTETVAGCALCAFLRLVMHTHSLWSFPRRYLAEASGLSAVMIDDLGAEDVAAYDGFIVGAPTWNTGADQERSGTAWDEFLFGDLTNLDLKGKKVAVFAVGDQAGYADNFVDAMDELHSCFTGQGAESIGMVANDGYEHEEVQCEPMPRPTSLIRPLPALPV